MEQLLNLFTDIAPLPDGLTKHFSNILRPKIFKKKTIIQREGEVSNYIYFIEKGLVRSLYLDKRKEITPWIMKEGDVIVSVQSFFTKSKSHENIEALEDCILWGISHEQLQTIYKTFPAFNLHRAVILEKYYALSEQRHFIRMQASGDVKYRVLMETHPELVNRVPAAILYSWLGVSRRTYTRMKAGYSIKNQKNNLSRLTNGASMKNS